MDSNAGLSQASGPRMLLDPDTTRKGHRQLELFGRDAFQQVHLTKPFPFQSVGEGFL